MEQTETYRLKLEKLSKAISGFTQSLHVEFTGKSDVEVDVLKNGQVQKFEYCIEIVWKMIKTYLMAITGWSVTRPNPVAKPFIKTALRLRRITNPLWR